MKFIKSIFILFFLFSFINLFSQEDYKALIERVQEAPYIFEGVVVASKPYSVSGGRYIHTSNTIEITKIFKGDLTCGTIELITKGGKLGDRSVKVSHSLQLQKGFQGIFICSGTNKELSQIDFFNETNAEKLEGIFENQSFIKYEYNGSNFSASDMWQQFETLPELYNQLDFVLDTSYIDCSSSNLIIPTNEVNNNLQNEDDFVMPIYNISDYNSLITNSELKKANQLNKPKSTNSDNTLTYTLANGIITGNTVKYFEFDVLLSQSDNNQYFNNGLIRLNYNNSTFGNNIVANNKIQVTRGVVISDAITYADPIPADISNNEIAIPLTTEFPIPNLDLYPLSSNLEKVIHIKIEIANCNGTNVSFTNQTTMGILSFYGISSTDTFGVSYDNIIATDNITVPPCKTTITSFTPTTIGGGTRSVLEIHGYLFGNTPGRVYFPNADNGGNTNLYVNEFTNSNYFNTWSDDLIKIEVRSNYNFDSGDTIVPYPIGSGNFIVQSNYAANNIDTSDTPLNINYSILNSSLNSYVFLAPDTSFKKKYVFRCSEAIANYKNGAMKIVIEKALRDWTCATGIHWVLGSDTTLIGDSSILNDGINYITFTNLGVDPLNNSPVLAYTNNYTKFCPPVKVAKTEVDLEISDIVNWFCDTLIGNSVPSNQRDIYAVLLHELGHAHNLNHVINPNSIMNYEYNHNTRMIEIYNDNSSIQGGNWIMNASMSTSFTSCSSFESIQLHPSPLCDPLYFSVNDLTNEDFVKVFPNPTSNIINIIFDEEIKDNIVITLSDIQGKVFINKKMEGISNDNIQLNLQKLTTGIYFISVKTGNKMFTSKIIKK